MEQLDQQQEVENDLEEVRQVERKTLEQSGRRNVMEGCLEEQRAVQKTQTRLPHELASVRGQNHLGGHLRQEEEGLEEGRAPREYQDEGVAIEVWNASDS
jgi:hypothetical protein